MATPAWSPATLYPPGSLVVPRTKQLSGPVPLPNGTFDSNADDWVLGGTGTGTVVWEATGGFQSPGCLHYQRGANTGENNDGSAQSDDDYPVLPGQSITLEAMGTIYNGTAGSSFACALIWLDASGVQVGSPSVGAQVARSGGSGWRRGFVTAQAPALAAKVRAAVFFNGSAGSTVTRIRCDNISWNYVAPGNPGLQYKAVQPAVGFSASTEPVWPPTLGAQVTDGQVIWEAVSMSRIVYQARAILKSGATEPTWPSTPGASVADNTILWTAEDPRITDPNCPNSKVVAIAKFKVYAGDKDVVRYSATLVPTDWTTEKDAGYLGTGVQQNGANDVALLNLYRANLIVMNATTMQQWQIDPNPEMMDLLDTMDGIGSIHHLAAVPVSNDLLYLSNKGVRSLGISGATNNLKSGDVGLPVDTMVQAMMAEAKQLGLDVLATYLPSMGQYWLCFNRTVPDDDPEPPAVGTARDVCSSLAVGDDYAEVMVYTITQVGSVGAWSRYIFPFAIDDWTQEGDDLYVRDGNQVYRISESIGSCDLYGEGEGGISGVPFDAILQWPWLDFGAPSVDKVLDSFDLVGYGKAWVEIGFDQSETGWFSEPYEVDPDTLPGTPVPLPLVAPSYSVRIRYHGWSPYASETDSQREWGFNAIGLNLR